METRSQLLLYASKALLAMTDDELRDLVERNAWCMRDFLSEMSLDMKMYIVSFLDFRSMCNLLLVNKCWNALLSDSFNPNWSGLVEHTAKMYHFDTDAWSVLRQNYNFGFYKMFAFACWLKTVFAPEASIDRRCSIFTYHGLYLTWKWRNSQYKRYVRKPLYMSNKLCRFLRMANGSCLSSEDIRRRIWQYIVDHNLKNPENPREILLDKKLQKLVRFRYTHRSFKGIMATLRWHWRMRFPFY